MVKQRYLYAQIVAPTDHKLFSKCDTSHKICMRTIRLHCFWSIGSRVHIVAPTDLAQKSSTRVTRRGHGDEGEREVVDVRRRVALVLVVRRCRPPL